MPVSNLPFPGYSWPFTQHAIAIKPETLYGLLACASYFEGKENPGKQITSLMVRNKLLTPNVRDGHADAWRDYQQVLAELGLIYSTKIEKKLKLTPAGRMLLAGEIGFSELMTAQAMRYQYPNGQKFDAPARKGMAKQTDNLIELHASLGVLIKPATLIARVLIGLEERRAKPILSIDECLEFLLPIKSNLEWSQAVDAILDSRKKRNITALNRHARRNIQDWYKFLGMTDFFVVSGKEIQLSEYGRYAIPQLKNFCDVQSQSNTFWKPKNSSKAERMTWFDYFGEIPLELQLVRPKEKIDADYEKTNYIGGIEEDDEIAQVGAVGISLSEVKARMPKANTSKMSMNPDVALSNLQQGIMRRQTKAIMHDEIVLELAQHFKAQGAQVFEDRDSVDLLIVWPDKKENLLEVKTVTRRNLQHRIRLGVGQLEEYAYRRSESTGSLCDKVLVINADLPPEGAWYLDFLNQRMNITLISRTKKGYRVYESANCGTKNRWQF